MDDDGGTVGRDGRMEEFKKKENVSIETGTFPIKLDDYHFQLINVNRAPFILPLWRTELIALRGISMEWKLPSFFYTIHRKEPFSRGNFRNLLLLCNGYAILGA